MTTTTDLSKFRRDELRELEFILRAWREHGLPSDFNNDEVVPMFNQSSGWVFLTNSDYQCAILDEGKLVSHYSCPECGHEGVKTEMYDGDSCCIDYMDEVCG